MSKVDWGKAPKDAEACICGCFTKWVGKNEYDWDECNLEWIMSFDCWSINDYINQGYYEIEKRPNEWKEGEKRMDQIATNGGGGEHYAELDDFDKQPRYKGDDGLGHIDEFARDNSIEDFRAAMRFTIGKYEKRLGKKDAMSKELYKMSDYYNRWSEVEKKLEQEKGE